MGKTREEIQLGLTDSFNKSLTSVEYIFFFPLGCEWVFFMQDKILSVKCNISFFMALLRRGNDKVDAIPFIQELGD